MNLRRIVLAALMLILAVALALFLISKYASPALPRSVNSDVLLWGVVISAAAAFLAAFKDVLELVERLNKASPSFTTEDLKSFLAQNRADVIHKRNRSKMLDKVDVFWIKGVLESSLHGALLIQLGMEYVPKMVNHPWNTVLHQADQAGQAIPKGTRTIEVFDRLGKSLLILGKPGSGKTTALLELARDLITRAREDKTHPIPVVFNLSSWGKSRESLKDWLVGELNSKYDVPTYVGEVWIAGDELLLLLDGLDEVRETYRNECVDAINHFQGEHMPSIVVCSRTDDYQALASKLELPGAIVQEPLDPRQIDQYLTSLGPKLETVRQAVWADSALQHLAQSPLVLSIIALAYQGLSIEDLQPGTLEEKREHLFTTYVSRMFVHRKATGEYSPLQIVRKLVWLSQLLKTNAQTVFRIEDLQPTALKATPARMIYAACVILALCFFTGLAVGSPCGLFLLRVTGILTYGIAAGVFYGLTSSLGMFIACTGVYKLKYRVGLGIAFGCALAITAWSFTHSLLISSSAGLVVGTASIFAYRTIGLGAPTSNTVENAVSTISTARKRLGWSWRTGAVGFVRRLPLGLVFGVAAGLTCSLVFGWSIGLQIGVALGLTLPFAGALSYGMIDVNIGPISRPNEGIWRTLQNSVRFGIVAGLWVGGVMAYVGILLARPVDGVTFGALFFVAGFTVSATIAGGFAVLKHGILRLLLRFFEGVPLRYPRLLNRGVHHIFLRRVGSGYIFVHRLLLEHFATRDIHATTI